MRIDAYFSLIVAGFILQACHSGGSNSDAKKESVDSAMVGLWVDKNQSEELKDTGKLESLCSKMKAEPLIGKPSDTRLIEKSGAVFIYTPDHQHVPLGTVSKNGDFSLRGDFKSANPNANAILSMKVDGDILTINANYSNSKGSVDVKTEYVRTNSEDIRKYFEAIDACPQ